MEGEAQGTQGPQDRVRVAQGESSVRHFYNGLTCVVALSILVALIVALRGGDVTLACIMLIALCVIFMRWHDVSAQRRRMKFIKHVNEGGR